MLGIWFTSLVRLTTATSDACELANPYFQAQLSQPALDPVGAFLEDVFGSKQGTAAALQSAAALCWSACPGCWSRTEAMPGKKHEMRGVNSLAALLSFYKHGNTSTSGRFRMHVEKLLQFLRPERLKRLETRKESAARRWLELIEAGRPVPGSWEQFVVTIVKGKRFEVSDFWTEVESGLAPEHQRQLLASELGHGILSLI